MTWELQLFGPPDHSFDDINDIFYHSAIYDLRRVVQGISFMSSAWMAK